MIIYEGITHSLIHSYVIFLFTSTAWHECNSSLPRYYGVSDKLYHLVDDLLSISKKNSDKSSDGKIILSMPAGCYNSVVQRCFNAVLTSCV